MRWIVLTAAGLALAGFAAAQEQDTGEFDPESEFDTENPSDNYDPSRHIVTDEDQTPSMSLGESKTDSPVHTEYGSSEDVAASGGRGGLAKNRGLYKAKAEHLEGRTVVTLTGEEVGEIREVGESPENGERVATIDAGGFLGVGQKTIAVPLSKLHRSPSDGENVRISLMRSSIETLPDFDESELDPDE